MIGLRRKNGVTQAILKLTSGAVFTVRDDSYEGIEWHSPEVPIPSKKEIENKIAELEADEPMRCAREIRDWYLQQSDWTQGYDIRKLRGPEWCAAWDEYRRDITKTTKPYFLDENDPAPRGIDWPERPPN